MPAYTIERFEVRTDAIPEAERAMFTLADYVRGSLADAQYTSYRNPDAPAQFIAMLRFDNDAAEARFRAAPGTRAFHAALAPLLVGAIDSTHCQLVTSSDLAPRHRRR